mmetsp:Transcript_5215/g.8203  ORF Transcript_5215/g.8203 Transcript_5215/m.8203 type:complete len:88 (-) Transcript_5215:323-586(-)
MQLWLPHPDCRALSKDLILLIFYQTRRHDEFITRSFVIERLYCDDNVNDGNDVRVAIHKFPELSPFQGRVLVTVDVVFPDVSEQEKR